MMKLRLLNCLSTKTVSPVILLQPIRSFSQFSIQRQKKNFVLVNNKSTWINTPLYKSPQFMIRSYADAKQVKRDEEEDDEVAKKDSSLAKAPTQGLKKPITLNDIVTGDEGYGFSILTIIGVAGALIYYFNSDFPPIADLIVNYGVDQLESSNTAEAVQAFQVARTISPFNKFAWFNEGNTFAEQGEYKKAIKCYNKAIEADPNYIDAIYNKGILLFMVQRYELALKQFDSVLAINPNYTPALNNRGNALVELSRYEEARKSFDDAIKLDPMYADAIINKQRLDVIENSQKKKKSSWF